MFRTGSIEERFIDDEMKERIKRIALELHAKKHKKGENVDIKVEHEDPESIGGEVQKDFSPVEEKQRKSEWHVSCGCCDWRTTWDAILDDNPEIKKEEEKKYSSSDDANEYGIRKKDSQSESYGSSQEEGGEGKYK